MKAFNVSAVLSFNMSFSEMAVLQVARLGSVLLRILVRKRSNTFSFSAGVQNFFSPENNFQNLFYIITGVPHLHAISIYY